MAGKSEIEAGRAYVSLFLKDQGWVKGLNAAGQRLSAFGRGMSVFGAAVTGVGTAIVAPFVAMAHEFANVGSALNDMSGRTGVSIETLSELKYAAEQSGASLEDVEKALRFMAKSGKDVKTFDAVAARIAAIEDPSKRAKAAIEAWGKGGTSLLPMVAELAQLRHEAREAGLVLSNDAGKRADALGDAFSKLSAVVKSVRLIIGDAVSGTIKGAVGTITNVAISVGKWVNANRELFNTILKIGAVVAGAGAVITGMGISLTIVGTALSAFTG